MASNAAAVRRWLETAADDLRDRADLLNVLNVFPFADADTGSNLSATVQTAAQAAQVIETSDLSELITLAGQAALEEARGNSGTLFAVFLAAMGEGLGEAPRLHAEALASGLSAGSVRAWSVLTDPVAGTMLSVLTEVAAIPVPEHGEPGSNQQLLLYLQQVLSAAQRAVLDSGRDQEILCGKRHVDAGALGMLIILDALRRVISGQPQDFLQPVEDVVAQLPADLLTQSPQSCGPGVTQVDSGVDRWVEVMVTMDMTALGAATVRHELAEMGDSVIVSAVSQIDADQWRWRVHAHVPEQQAALEVLRQHGDPRSVTVVKLSVEQPLPPYPTADTGLS